MHGVIDDFTPDYDVIVIGGALSGSATALLLLRKNPGIRVLIVERSETFGRQAGEATVEVSGYFLGRMLGLTHYLNDSHIAKQGLRVWFANDKVETLDQASEVGPRYLARLPSYQIDRAALDEEVLRRAENAGASVLRPAVVSNIRLITGGNIGARLKTFLMRHPVAREMLENAHSVPEDLHHRKNLAFHLGLSLYYWGVVRAVFENGERGFLTAPFTHHAAGPISALMRVHSGRFAKIAARRRRLGILGRTNDHRCVLIPGSTLKCQDIWKVLPLTGAWMKLELTEGWRSWGGASDVIQKSAEPGLRKGAA